MTAWGWVHLIVGSIALVTGLSVLSRQLWAAIRDVFLAMASATRQLLVITALPLRSLAIIGITVLAIYGLVVQGNGAVAAEGEPAGG